MRTFFRAVLPAVCVAALLANGWPPPPSAADDGPPAGAEIDKLIAQLGSASFAVREAATEQLKQREEAIPALRRALKSPDAEVARRAAAILNHLAAKQKKRAFDRLVAAAKNGQVDLAVEILVRQKEWDDEDACWQVLFELAGRLTDLEQKEFGTISLQPDKPGGPGRELPIRDFRRYRENMHPKIVAGSRLSRRDLREIGPRAALLRAEEIDAGNTLLASFLVSCGPVQVRSVCGQSVIFTGTSVEWEGDLAYALVVCDGDFKMRGSFKDSLLIARGDVTCFDFVRNSRIIASGGVHLAREVNAGLILVRDTKVKEKEAKPLGFVTFFDPAQVGIKVAKADGGLRVQEAVRGKPFARAGVRTDDLLVGIDGAAVADPTVFRRLLRAKVAVEGELALKLRRGEQTLELRVPCKD
jgi:hypothetical protein